VSGIGDNALLEFLFDEHITVRHQFKRSGVFAVERMQQLLTGDSEIIHTCLKGDLKIYEK